MTTIIAPDPELVWTCDENGHWFQEERVRIRHGDGWREVCTDALSVSIEDLRQTTERHVAELRKPIAAVRAGLEG